jgi:hypothetical protein
MSILAGERNAEIGVIRGAQMSLFNEAEVYTEPEPTVIERHTRKPKRTKEELAKDLPVVEVVIDLPEDERTCNICESDLHPIGRELLRRELSPSINLIRASLRALRSRLATSTKAGFTRCK